jgi:DNA-damage-inducible protein J
MIHARVDEVVKEKASATLAKMGMSISDAVRMMLVRVAAGNALPFEVRVPNATTVKAMRSADKREGKRFNSAKAVFEELDA